MEEIKNQVSSARWSLTMQRWVEVMPWCLFAGLLIAAIGILVPKIWFVDFEETSYFWSWVAGSIGGALVLSILLTWLQRRDELEAAMELDRRFGLKERISSVLALSAEERQSEVGAALVDDAGRRVAGLNVGEKFPVAGNWSALLPVVPAVMIAIVAMQADQELPVDPVEAQQKVAASAIKNRSEALKRKLEQLRKDSEKEGIPPTANDLLKKVVEGVDRAFKNETKTSKEAMAKLNDLSKDLKDRREQLAGNDRLKQQLNQIKDLKQGPADKMAQALKKGDFEQALKEVERLAQELKDNKLNPEQQKELAKQLEQLKDKIEQLAQAHEKAKQDLQKQVQEKLQQGDRQGAEQMQQQLDKLAQQDQQMKDLNELSQKIGQASQDLQQGKGQEAGQQLERLAKDLEGLEKQAKELEALDKALEDVADAKKSMGCKECQGQGCKQCNGEGGDLEGDGQGQGQGDKKNGKPGQGLGQGQGRGARPENPNDTKFYDTQVRAKVGKGGGTISGNIGGPNIAGEVRESIKQQLQAGEIEGAKALSEKPLPKAAREHAQEYLNRLREGDVAPPPAAPEKAPE